ncbi:hypothetical protein, partial [Salmonella sp. s51228]|uniref:hypothetical protein n=1 Tax=Salmonella sp. s51228 TaxID=3159652 RepID=UPI00397F3529
EITKIGDDETDTDKENNVSSSNPKSDILQISLSGDEITSLTSSEDMKIKEMEEILHNQQELINNLLSQVPNSENILNEISLTNYQTAYSNISTIDQPTKTDDNNELSKTERLLLETETKLAEMETET